ncbi:MAG: GDSL-type esterase/lipase family protein [Thermodesulfovibrionales bacterium]|nr:GDSL-type esterase/lipase family protein [Thermodesulfovibrionales bacterium]
MRKSLMFLGDSLTEFYDWHERFSNYEVYNLGISGETVEELLERLPRIYKRIKKVDYIFLMTGINNIAMENFNILGYYGQIVKELSSNYVNTTIVVQSILPVILYWIDNNLIRKINSSLREIASFNKADYLDIYSLFLDEKGKVINNYLLDDGVHISIKGYEIWSEAVEKYLESKIISSPLR